MNEKILITEDDRVIALDLKISLQKLGYKIIGPAHSATQAVTILRKSQPDLVLIDVELNGLEGGFELAADIRQKLQTPLIFISGYSPDFVMGKIKDITHSSFVSKPIDLQELNRQIEKFLAVEN